MATELTDAPKTVVNAARLVDRLDDALWTGSADLTPTEWVGLIDKVCECPETLVGIYQMLERRVIDDDDDRYFALTEHDQTGFIPPPVEFDD